MRTCIQRVKNASVFLPEKNEFCGRIDAGLLILLGVSVKDTEKEAELLARKCAEMRIFEDEAGKMNRSITDIGGKILVVSQFTLYADCRKGRRPSFTEAAQPELAETLYLHFVETVREKYGIPVETGVFRTEMQVQLLNDGPVTIWIDTDNL
ncbi:D-aminoacyl-tRNA deacylase [Planctomycetales bacterium]|nr:D-aminoacyl-tRNA deacylase [Planctomycetales bacterium]